MRAVKSRTDRCYVVTFPDDGGGEAGSDRRITSVGQERIPTTVKISIITQFLTRHASARPPSRRLQIKAIADNLTMWRH